MLYLPLGIVFFSALISKKSTGTWYSPGAFFSLFWLFFLVTPILFASEFNIGVYGIWYIAIFVITLSCGSLIATKVTFKKSIIKQKNKNIGYKNFFLSLLIINFISTCGIISLLIYSIDIYKGFSSYSGILSIPNLISIDRYSGELYYPILIKYSLYLIYPGALISGIILSNFKVTFKSKFLCFMPLVICIALGILEGSRTSILIGFILFFSAFISGLNNQFNFNDKIHSYKIFLSSLFALLFFLFLFVFVQWLRQGLDPIVFDYLILRMKAYLFGYLSAFTLWFDSYEKIFTPQTLFSTFAGPLNLLNITERELGFYLPVYINKDVSTNIFTALRALVSDFSIIGSLLISFFIGLIFQLVFDKKRKNNFDGFIPMSIFYSFTIYSPLISIFHYNSILFSWVIVYFIIKLKI